MGLIFNKTCEVPSSKSYANRLLILAALNPRSIEVKNLPLSSDVEAMIACLREVGLEIEKSDAGVVVKNSFPDCEKESEPLVLDTKDGGTTNRFLIPFLARGKRKYILEPEGHMRERPMEGLLNVLKKLNVKTTYKEGSDWITIQGPVVIDGKLKEIFVDCSHTTQFLTGVALALSDLEVSVKPENLKSSLPYWELTQEIIKLGKSDENIFYNPVDFSSLSYPLGLAAVKGKVLIKNCHSIDKFQADAQFIDVLKSMGAKIYFSQEGLICERSNLKGIDFDGSQCPDVIPTILYVCSFANGLSTISNLEVLTYKECNRFLEMINILEKFEVDFTYDSQKYEIKIQGEPERSLEVDYAPPEDHRMVMVTHLFQKTLGGGKITKNSHHVRKSFANFFDVIDN